MSRNDLIVNRGLLGRRLMAACIDVLRTGAWLTRERMRLVGFAVLVAAALGTVYLAVTSDGLNDQFGRPLGTDFSSFYAAGTLVQDGTPAAVYDHVAHFAREKALFGSATQFYAFQYPPLFLLIAGVLAKLPYALALMAWLGATLTLYLWAIRAIVATMSPFPFHGGLRTEEVRNGGQRVDASHATVSRSTSSAKAEVKKEWLLFALAFPAAFINLGHGQNGFLTAGLFGLALAVMGRRPFVAGILFGLLAYKPQFGLMIPLVLLVTGQWRVIAAAAATVILLVALTLVAFGPGPWQAFFASLPFTRTVLLEQGNVGWHKIQSVFSWVRMWGGPVSLAYLVQTTLTIAVVASLVWLWRSNTRFPIKAAALLIGTLLATPFSLDYDLMLLAPAIAFLAADGRTNGFVPWEKTVLAMLWIVPLVTRSVASATLIPLAVPTMLAAFAILLHRTASEVDASRFGFFASRGIR
jgi:hypothetical protein